MIARMAAHDVLRVSDSAVPVPPHHRPLDDAAAAVLSRAALAIRPLVWRSEFLHSLLDIAAEETQRDEPATSAENIEALITAGTEEGLIQEDDRKLIQSVVAFGDKVVREVMTPRPNIVAIQADRNAGGAA